MSSKREAYSGKFGSALITTIVDFMHFNLFQSIVNIYTMK